MPLVIAHRGASAVEPENSLAAFRLALAQGADGIELDVHNTADGDFAVFHDPVIGGRHIAELPLAEVRRHRLANGERVPTLEEALAAITPEAIAFVEVKSMPTEADDALLARLDAAPRPDRCQVHAFDHGLIRRVGRSRPALPTGVLSEEYSVDPAAQVRAAGARVLWQRADLIDAPLAALVREAGYALYAWTVDDPQRMRALLDLGVDGICTNRPDVAREVMG